MATLTEIAESNTHCPVTAIAREAMLRRINRKEDEMYFEGAEKRLEIDLTNKAGAKSLRELPRAFWDGIMEKIHAKIVDHIGNAEMDAYLLTESSLFVQDSRVVLITCGTTRLLNSLDILCKEIESIGRQVEWVGYSRKNFSYPWEQQAPHSSISEEYTVLHNHFPEGQPFILGPLDADHYFIFIYDNIERPRGLPEVDQQLNINMYDLDNDVAKNFFWPEMSINSPATAKLRKDTGLEDVLEGFQPQDMAFTPCGYSMNAMNRNFHHSIHVTPETHCSYASFESTAPLQSYRDLIQKVLRVFRPRRFTTILLLDESCPAGLARAMNRDIGIETISGYQRTNYSVNEFAPGYFTIKCNYIISSAAS